jgi:hypothetical protein
MPKGMRKKTRLTTQEILEEARNRLPSNYHLSQFEKLARELAARRLEAIRLYEPQDWQESFHQCEATNRIIRGGNRSGKTTAASVECARAALGRDPHGKYPDYSDSEENMIIFVVGFDQRHIGRKLHRILFRAGAFWIIRDEETRRWRTFDPEGDAHREKQKKPAPPLIPPRAIKNISWVNKSQRVWDHVVLVNGTEIYAFPSRGEAPQGDAVDLYWIDEDIQDDNWVDEAHARLSDRKGKFMWSALPHSKNSGLLDMSQLAEEEVKHEGEPDTVEFVPSFSGNPYIDPEEKAKRIKEWSARGEDVVAVRDLGQFAANQWLVYHDFSMVTHGFDKSDLEGGRVPDDWCRYMVVDPGRTVCAVLFAALPPPASKYVKEFGDFVLLYDELYLKQCNAKMFGENVERAARGTVFYEWIIDEHGGRVRDMAFGTKPIRAYYEEELKSRRMKSQSRGAKFVPGCDDIQLRVQAASEWLVIRNDGTTRLRVLKGALPTFEWEMQRYRKKVDQRTRLPTDEPDKKKSRVHLIDDFEYLAARDPKWHKPPKRNKFKESFAVMTFMRKERRNKASAPPQQIVLG